MRNLILAAAAVALIAAPASFASAAAEKKAPTYDCTKPGNANKTACKTAAAAPAAAPVTKPAAISQYPAGTFTGLGQAGALKAPKAAPTYDCTKKGNANKAACKTAAAAPAAPAATPAAAAKPVAPAAAPVAAKPAPVAAAAAAPTPVKGGGMKACATQWDGYTQAQKDAYKAKAEGKLSAKGHKLSGYNVFTGECMKK